MVEDIAAVQESFPGRTVTLEGQGQLSSAWRVDSDLIVRVPRHAFGIDRLRFEVRLLEALRPRLSVPIPEVVAVELDLPVGRAFVAHRRIPGHVLGRGAVAALTPQGVDAVGEQVGRFLRELHAIDLADLNDVPVQTAAQFATVLTAEVEALLKPRLRLDQVDALKLTLAELECLPAGPVVLAHTDIGGNIVVDENDRVGIIDFGSCFATHPAFDLASLSVLGDDLVRAACAHYPLLGTLSHEAEVVARTFFLQDALYGARQEDWDYVHEMFASVS